MRAGRPPPRHLERFRHAVDGHALVQAALSCDERSELLDLYRAAQANIDELIGTASDTSVRGQAYRSRLTSLSRAITETMADLDAAARGRTARSLPEVYALGAQGAARDIGERFNWSQIHREAVQQLASETFDDLLAATRFVRRDTKAFIRIATREHAAAVLLEGKTAAQAGRELARRVEQRGIAAVTYRNGARHTLRDYSDTVVRTRSALASSGGQVNIVKEHGIRWVQVSDGAGCGWDAHDSSDLANGSVRTLADAEAYPVSHPRCARSFALLPVETKAKAQRLAEGHYSDVRVYEPTSGGGGHDRRLAQRQARLEARSAKVRAELLADLPEG